MHRGLADTRRNDDRIRLEHNTVVDDLVDGEGGEVVVLDERALVDGVPVAGTVSGIL